MSASCAAQSLACTSADSQSMRRSGSHPDSHAQVRCCHLLSCGMIAIAVPPWHIHLLCLQVPADDSMDIDEGELQPPASDTHASAKPTAQPDSSASLPSLKTAAPAAQPLSAPAAHRPLQAAGQPAVSSRPAAPLLRPAGQPLPRIQPSLRLAPPAAPSPTPTLPSLTRQPPEQTPQPGQHSASAQLAPGSGLSLALPAPPAKPTSGSTAPHKHPGAALQTKPSAAQPAPPQAAAQPKPTSGGSTTQPAAKPASGSAQAPPPQTSARQPEQPPADAVPKQQQHRLVLNQPRKPASGGSSTQARPQSGSSAQSAPHAAPKPRRELTLPAAPSQPQRATQAPPPQQTPLAPPQKQHFSMQPPAELQAPTLRPSLLSKTSQPPRLQLGKPPSLLGGPAKPPSQPFAPFQARNTAAPPLPQLRLSLQPSRQQPLQTPPPSPVRAAAGLRSLLL